uniref:Coiled-coil domain containing 33 n=1 Tax=Sinocyclocheilus grahami TaxID=75366 RepID=A0A672K544_SINGR
MITKSIVLIFIKINVRINTKLQDSHIVCTNPFLFLLQELENYRAAMHKMADDILALRSQVSALESENSQLRRDLSLHQDLTLLDDTDTDVMTKSEIADRIGIIPPTSHISFKHIKISQGIVLMRIQVISLLELLQKNDIEKEFVQLQRAHQQQQAVLKKYQIRSGKISALEDTVRQQEKVFNAEELKRREIEPVLAAENSRLREELQRLRNLPPPVIIQQPPFSDSEKLELLTQLARAEGRIQTLEQQLKENSRQWGKEKQEMLTRLSEYEHGFARTSTMILHDLPVVSMIAVQLEPLK